MTLHRFKMITKPFWVPIITAIYILMAGEINSMVIIALFFGWIGDLLLMRGRKSWFIAGAFSFLIGHVIYIIVFFQSSGGWTIISAHLLLSVLFLIPYIAFLIYLKHLLGHYVTSIFIAAALYLSFLMLMSYTALLRVWNVSTTSFLLTYLGSILFIISDTLIGVRNFKRKFKGIGTIIVITYIAAQLMIIGGLL